MKTTHIGFAWLVASVMGIAVAQDQPQQDPQRIQQPQPTQQVDPSRRSGAPNSQSQANMGLDAHIANCLMLGNQEEIVLLQMGSNKTENSEIKQAAEKMIQDHQQFIQQLQPHASIQTQELMQWLKPTEESKSEQAQPKSENSTTQAGTQNNAVPGQRRATPAQVVSNSGKATGQDEDLSMRLMEIEKNVAKECIRLNQQAMQGMEGSDFDKAFVASQVAAHMSMLAKLKGSEGAASGELQQLIQKGQETTKQHKEKLVSLMKEMKHDSSSKKDKNSGSDSEQEKN